jgi:NAD(P)-dependent dehydrogenase (short-subunit alcohol dehydrogenase family)
MWMDYCDPGLTLAVEFKKAVEAFGKAPKVAFLGNHGVFVAADSQEEIKALYADIMDKLAAFVTAQGIPLEENAAPCHMETVFENAPVLRGLLGKVATVTAGGAFKAPEGPLTPDHIVYAGSFPLTADLPDASAVEAFKAAHGTMPKVVEIPGKVVFGIGADKNTASRSLKLAENGAQIVRIAAAFGGVRYLNDAERSFIENWEAENYRASVGGNSKALKGKVAVVTGGAQGFGYGIAQELAALGADLVIADMNVEGARKAAAELGAGAGGFAVNISDEAAVEALVKDIVCAYGGVDLLVANAGVVRAGSVKEFDLKDWSFVTNINYNGFFLCTKYFARVMSKQNKATGLWSDIVQVNSKSGLAGSKNNGAYAGSKFGTIGLVQSFALELTSDKIKVNAVCPGNYLDGPLWSDPVRGLFVQYLEAGKVPGAKTVEDVRAHYERQVPMNRGCFPADVARAIVYAVNQKYETGQAIPVTGGQIMMN